MRLLGWHRAAGSDNMKRWRIWLLLACVAIISGTVAWMLWPDLEEMESPSQPYATELADQKNAPRVTDASGETQVPDPTKALPRIGLHDSIHSPLTDRQRTCFPNEQTSVSGQRL